jgi:hypothetical protein
MDEGLLDNDDPGGAKGQMREAPIFNDSDFLRP